MTKHSYSQKETNGVRVTSLRKGIKNEEVKCSKRKVPKVPKDFPPLHTLCGAFGVVRSGKSNALVNLIQAYWDYKSLNMLFCISPTYESNTSLQTLPFEKDGIFTNPQNSSMALEVIKKRIEERKLEYDFEKAYKIAYKNWKKEKANEVEMALLNKMDFRLPKKVEWPKAGIFIDDMTHTELMANTINNELSHLCLHHRHLAGVGVSIFLALQTFKSGMPRVIRTNLGLILLFATCDISTLEEIHREICNNISFDTFKKIFIQATKGDHNFLLINKLAKDPNKQFGINFDQVFDIDMDAEKEKALKIYDHKKPH